MVNRSSKSRADLYQVKYNDLLKAYGNFWISSELAPTNMATYILEQLWGNTYSTSWIWFDSSVSNLESKYWIRK